MWKSFNGRKSAMQGDTRIDPSYNLDIIQFKTLFDIHCFVSLYSNSSGITHGVIQHFVSYTM